MPNKTRAQRKGSSRNIRTPSHRYDKKADFDDVEGEIVDIVHDPSRSAPLAKVKLEDGEERFIIAPQGLETGDKIKCGISAPIEPGNRLKLAEIPEGVPIHSIEIKPGEGGKLARSSGTYGTVKMHDIDKTVVELPSEKTKNLNPECKATVGVVAGSGRKEKPFVKAGSKHKAMKARGKKYPTVSAVSMNPVDHPFGGSTKPGKPKTTKSTAPPGQKAGSFGAKSSGKRED
ncbi:MAG: 50S ribosomal protein L2 [Candidatus Aenigmatarchaeota archaeon]